MTISKLNKKSKAYPQRLKHLSEPPAHLSVLGNLAEALNMPTIGIVGSRKVSAYGRAITEELAGNLASNGICVISGLALGVDSIAHLAAIRTKTKTIAVLPSGIKEVYPAAHRQLARDIVAGNGVLVSEYKDDFHPRRESFIQRNRIIAGLSDALLVTEAAEKSGSLYTANFALELGKTVLAVPGNINSPGSQGTNNLIKTGAVMVTEAKDIFDALGLTPKEPKQLDIYGDNEHESLILNLLQDGVSAGEELHQMSELETALFQQTITMLEIKGTIAPMGNNHWRLK